MSTEMETAILELAAFDETKEVNHLDNAIRATESIDVTKLAGNLREGDPRQRTAIQWFQVLVAIDQNLDPNFDENDPPEESIIPPAWGGIEYPSSADPKSIKDPATRAEYERMRKENSIKAARFRLQTRLRRLKSRATTDAGRFLIQYYTYSAKEQAELVKLLAKLPPARQKHFMGLYKYEGSAAE
jgi:hypothetical protein